MYLNFTHVFCILYFLDNIFGQAFQRTTGRYPRCWEGGAVMAEMLPLWFSCGQAKQVLSSLPIIIGWWFYFNQVDVAPASIKALGAESGTPEMPKGRNQCSFLSWESLQWVTSWFSPSIPWPYKIPPSEFYSSEPMVESCSVSCQLNKACACSLCKCCLACCNKCTCSYANTGADASLARHLLPGISAEYLEENTSKVKIIFSFAHLGLWRPLLMPGLP